jgi:hypothetical protein
MSWGPRQAVPGVQADPVDTSSKLLVEVVSPNFAKGKVGQKLVLSDMTEDQVKCLIESGAVRPVERPSKAELKKEASHG